MRLRRSLPNTSLNPQNAIFKFSENSTGRQRVPNGVHTMMLNLSCLLLHWGLHWIGYFQNSVWLNSGGGTWWNTQTAFYFRLPFFANIVDFKMCCHTIKLNNVWFFQKWKCMLQHTKRQVKLFAMHCFTMFITALCVIFLMKLQWPKNKSFFHRLTSNSSSGTQKPSNANKNVWTKR